MRLSYNCQIVEKLRRSCLVIKKTMVTAIRRYFMSAVDHVILVVKAHFVIELADLDNEKRMPVYLS